MSISDVDQDRVRSQINGSDLCLSCGLCCTGLLHDRAVLLPVEFNLAHEIGLTILTRDGDATPTFRLPCPCFQQGRCSTYAKRPEACGRYRCNLLRAFEAQEIDLHAALDPVGHAKALITEIETLIGDTNAAETIWQRAYHFAKHHGLRLYSTEFTRAFPQVQLKVSALYLLCDRHFEPVMLKQADVC
jgi:hypothetical protein